MGTFLFSTGGQQDEMSGYLSVSLVRTLFRCGVAFPSTRVIAHLRKKVGLLVRDMQRAHRWRLARTGCIWVHFVGKATHSSSQSV